MNLEPEEIKEEWDDDQADGSGGKVLAKFEQSQRTLAPVDVHEIPQVNQDGDSDGEEGKDADVFDRDDTAQTDAGQEQPLPPCVSEGDVALLIEANVAEDREGHEEDERSIEEDEAGLADVGIVEQQEAGGSDAGGQRVARVPHNHEDNGNGEGAEGGGHGAVGDIGDFVGNI